MAATVWERVWWQLWPGSQSMPSYQGKRLLILATSLVPRPFLPPVLIACSMQNQFSLCFLHTANQNWRNGLGTRLTCHHDTGNKAGSHLCIGRLRTHWSGQWNVWLMYMHKASLQLTAVFSSSGSLPELQPGQWLQNLQLYSIQVCERKNWCKGRCTLGRNK